MKARIVNLTGHLIRLGNDVQVATFMSQGRARLVSRPHPLDEVDIQNSVYPKILVPRIVQDERRIIDLPDPEEGVLYVVSGLVADVAQRDDVWAIGRREVANGGVVSGKALIRFDRIGLHDVRRPGDAEAEVAGSDG